MRLFADPILRGATALVLTVASFAVGAQTFTAITGTDAVIASQPDLSAPSSTRPGHHAATEESLLFGRVRDGVYTVDGMVAKLQLNYDVDGARFLYLFVPGIGTAVLSAAAEGNGLVATAQLHNNELTFTAGDHRFKLTGVALSDGHNRIADHLFVHLDREAWHLNRHPMVGFGNVVQLPYAWPGALPATTARNEDAPLGPPVPATLLPSRTAVQPAAPVSSR